MTRDLWPGVSGKCVECGQVGQPICLTAREPACDDGGVDNGGLCIACGDLNQIPCEGLVPCRGTAAPDKFYTKCVPAGNLNQPCLNDGKCGYYGLHCNSKGICEHCGDSGEFCCPPGGLPNNLPCADLGECRTTQDGQRCFGCGGDYMPICLTGVPCHGSRENVDGHCRPCGLDGQACCSELSPRCWEGSCGDGVCRKPAPPTPPTPPANPKTCNGDNWSFSTMDRDVFVKDPANKCITPVTYKANSAAEAYACARRAYGNDAVVTDTVYPYKFALTSAFGCHTVNVLGTDDSEAETCAQWQCINCSVTPGDCV